MGDWKMTDKTEGSGLMAMVEKFFTGSTYSDYEFENKETGEVIRTKAYTDREAGKNISEGSVRPAR